MAKAHGSWSIVFSWCRLKCLRLFPIGFATLLAIGQVNTRLAKIVRPSTCICITFVIIVPVRSLLSIVFLFWRVYVYTSFSFSILFRLSIVELISLDSLSHLADKTHCLVVSIAISSGRHYLIPVIRLFWMWAQLSCYQEHWILNRWLSYYYLVSLIPIFHY